ncbi:MAG: TM2 domain-containing membrane protein YozV [Pirellulaceae bacterium]|jgi:TM2 domain-containing membrane protein YozV
MSSVSYKEIAMQTTERHPTHSVVFGYVLWIFGIFGAHRFYFGRSLSGLLYLCTLGLLGIGWLVDLVLIPSMEREASRTYTTGPFDYNVAWVLCTFLGAFGIHRFYLGKIFTGALYLFTGGLFGLGIIYDWLTLNEQVHNANCESHGWK